MPSWFSKVFSTGAAAPTQVSQTSERKPDPLPVRDASTDAKTSGQDVKRARNVITPRILKKDEASSSLATNGVRIRARIPRDQSSFTLLLNRPLATRTSGWFTSSESASSASPLAAAIFELDTLDSVLIHEATVTVTKSRLTKAPWNEVAVATGRIVRNHMEAGLPVFTEEFISGIPPEMDIRDKLQDVIEREINPGIAAHSGAITLDRIEGNTVFVQMMGGCQGCAASAVTLRQGIHRSFRDAVPNVGAILDVTEHTAGTNPYYTELPAGM